MKLSFLFWNFNCRLDAKEEICASLALHHQIDILILTEMRTDPESLKALLEVKGQTWFFHEYPEEPIRGDGSRRFQVFSRGSDIQLSLLRTESRIGVWKLRTPGSLEILMGVVHLKSVLSYPGFPNASFAQARDARKESLIIRETENSCGHMRTLLVGDFNMNPYHEAMISREGFGAMMSRELASRHTTKKITDEQPRTFYNPAWSLMGRQLPSAPGTYYHDNTADPQNTYWHTLDQVLIRPDLLRGFRDEDFAILTSVPMANNIQIELMRLRTKHWKIEVSDHLPITFQLETPEE